MKILTSLLIFINILPVFCVIEDCQTLGKFLKKHGYNFDLNEDCCDIETDSKYTYEIKCEDGHITELNTEFFNYNTIDFSSFPLLEKLTKLTIDGDVFPNKILSSRFFDLKSLKILNIHKTYKMPANVNPASPVEEIYLDENDINAFPYVFANLKKLRVLSLAGNQIASPLTTDIKKFPVLEELDISKNNMEGELIIPDSLKSLNINNNKFSSYSKSNSNKVLEKFYATNCNINTEFLEKIANIKTLKDLVVTYTKISKLPNNLFNLTKLETFNISNNPQLQAKIINFGDTNPIKIKKCDFKSTTISCYQPNTCANEENFNYKNCTEKEIESIRYGLGVPNSSFTTIKFAKFYYYIFMGLSLIVFLYF